MARSRVIDPEAISACMEMIAGMEGDITDLVANERVDRALMYAEMDTQKAEESLKKDMGKLSSNWFQTKQEAKTKKQQAKLGDKGELDAGKETKGKGKDNKPTGNQKEKGKRGAESDSGSRKKQKVSAEDTDELKDNGDFARQAKRSYKAAKRRGEVNERAELMNARNEKRKGVPKLTNFEKKMKKLETEKPQTGKKRSKNQFKSSKRYKRHK
jgi:hypothetical protein